MRPRAAAMPVSAHLGPARDGARLEAEADRIARRFEAGPLPPANPQSLAARVPLRASATAAGGAPPLVQDMLRSAGRALPDAARDMLEAGFGYDFSAVRVHDDRVADTAAASLGALAFTYGRDVAFRSGLYAPSTAAGRALLAHELTHVVQQAGAPRLQLKADGNGTKGTAPKSRSPERQRLEVETRLFGLEDLFDRYQTFLAKAALHEAAARDPVGFLATILVDVALDNPLVREMRALDADMRAAGFSGGVRQFGAMVGRYEQMFERDTITLAGKALDQYDALLRREASRYRQAGQVSQLHAAIAGTGANAAYEKGVSYALKGSEDAEIWLRTGEAKVRKAAIGHPIVQEKDFPRWDLARAEEHEAWALLRDYIAGRREDVARTRASLADDKLMIYGLDQLMAASLKAQGIVANSIFHKIVVAKQKRVHWDRLLPELLLGVIAVIAGLLSFGTGTVAVVGAGAAFGIGAYQAFDTFRSYEIQTAAYGAKLTSDNPSFGWVIVSVVGAGLDAGGLVKVFKEVPELTSAIKAFNAGEEAGDATKLMAKLDRLDKVDAKIRAAIKLGAMESAKMRAAWTAVVQPGARLYATILPGAREFGQFVFAVYLSARQGIRRFDLFLRTREAAELLGDIAKLTPQELAKVKAGYLQAIDEMEGLVTHGKKLGLADDEVLRFMELRGEGLAAANAEAAMEAASVRKAADALDAAYATSPFGRFHSMKPLQDASLAKYQQIVDEAYEAAERAWEAGWLAKGLNKNQAIGAHMDAIARTRLRQWYANEGIMEGRKGIVQVNRRLTDPVGEAYRIPDVRIGDVILDASLEAKDMLKAQVVEFFKFGNPRKVIIVRPTRFGGSYSIP